MSEYLNTFPSTLKAGDILNFTYLGQSIEGDLPCGNYKIQCWGASSGYRTDASKIAKGGYVEISLDLVERDSNSSYHLFVTVGGNGYDHGGFNGGGQCSWNSNNHGGGASDVRIFQNDIFHRLLSAGGGGSQGMGSSSGSAAGAGAMGAAPSGRGSNNTGATGCGGAGSARANGYGGAGGAGWAGGYGCYPDGSLDDDRGGRGGSSQFYNGASFSATYSSEDMKTINFVVSSGSYKAGTDTIVSPTGDATVGNLGDGYVRITYMGIQSYLFNIFNLSDRDFINKHVIYSYQGKVKSLFLPKGRYKFECYGAYGGTRGADNRYPQTTYGGKPGYASGIFTMSTHGFLYLAVGGNGRTRQGFNGGGAGCYTTGYGGGASHISLVGENDSLNPLSANILYSRLIVAGGGGSQGRVSSTGGSGGGTSGGANAGGGCGTAGGVGTQTSAGGGNAACVGAFGRGGAGIARANGYGGAGGAGWYGGGGCYPDGSADDDKAGSGGSGFVFSETYASSVANISSNPNFILEDKHKLTSPSLSTGVPFQLNGIIPWTDGTIVITPLEIYPVSILFFDNNHFKSYDKSSDSFISL